MDTAVVARDESALAGIDHETWTEDVTPAEPCESGEPFFHERNRPE